MIILSLGSHLVVDNATKIADSLKFESIAIGITIVALGTSLPELFTAVVSVKRKNYNLFIGNIIGSNVINIVFVLGFTSLITDVQPTIDDSSKLFYIFVIFSLSHLMVIFSTLLSKNVSKISGFILLLLYLLFLYKML